MFWLPSPCVVVVGAGLTFLSLCGVWSPFTARFATLVVLYWLVQPPLLYPLLHQPRYCCCCYSIQERGEGMCVSWKDLFQGQGLKQEFPVVSVLSTQEFPPCMLWFSCRVCPAYSCRVKYYGNSSDKTIPLSSKISALDLKFPQGDESTPDWKLLHLCVCGVATLPGRFCCLLTLLSCFWWMHSQAYPEEALSGLITLQ